MLYYGKEIDDDEINKIKEILKIVYCKSKVMKNKRSGIAYVSKIPDLQLLQQNKEPLYNFLNDLYHTNQFGYKSIVKILGDIVSYTQIRKLLVAVGIDVRHGTSTITTTLKEIRSHNAKEKGTFVNWTETNPEWLLNSSRHLNGFYWNNSLKKHVYLRSTWEYAYAYFLNENNVIWDVECRTYMLSTGKLYRPDFFIFDEYGKLLEIVEIKSLYNYESEERLSKFLLFQKEYPEIKTKLFTKFEDITSLFKCPRGMGSMIREWKIVREQYKTHGEKGCS